MTQGLAAQVTATTVGVLDAWLLQSHPSLDTSCLLQRYGQSSLFKRTILEYIAEDLLTKLPATPEEAPLPTASAPSPIMTGPNTISMEYLYEVFDFQDSEVINRDQVSAGLTRLGGLLRTHLGITANVAG